MPTFSPLLLLVVGLLILVGFGFSGILVSRAQAREKRLLLRRDSVLQRHIRAQPIDIRLFARARAVEVSFQVRIASIFGVDMDRPDICVLPWWVIVVGSGVGAEVAASAASSLMGPLSWLGLPVVWIIVSRTIFGHFSAKRRGKLLVQFPDALMMIVRAVRVGVPVTEAIHIIAHEQPQPTSGEFALVANQLSIGEPLETAILAMARHAGLPEDYLAKPLVRDRVARHFGGFVLGRAPASATALGGRVLAITGVRGGCGASTIATNLAWHFGVTLRHHTVLVDPDLYRGNAAFLLNLIPGDGLSAALESPLRIDTLLAERAAQPAAERLHVLAGESPVGVLPGYASGAAQALIDALRKRYNFIVLDVPFAPVPLYRDLLEQAHQQVLVMEPSLVSLRDVLRLNTYTPSHGQPPLIVLNRLGLPGGLTRRQVEDGLKRKVDIVLPDMPKQMRGAANLGEPAIITTTAYRKVIVEMGQAIAGAGVLDSLAASAPPAPVAKRSRWFGFGGTK